MNFIRKLKELQQLGDILAHKGQMGGLTNYELEFSTQTLASIMVLQTTFDVWEKCGSRIFQLSDNLVEAFTHTDIPLKMCPNEFHYPFDSFIIESTNRPLFVTKTPAGERPIYAVLYSYDRKLMAENNIMAINLKGEMSQDLGYDRSMYGFFSTSDIGMERIRFSMNDEMSFEEMEKQLNQMIIESIADHSDMTNMVNILYNTIMYINDPTRTAEETETTHTRKVKFDSEGHVGIQKYILLNTPKKYKSLKEYTEEGGRKIDIRFPVRGHWRNQPYGEERKERKHVWIMPFWKGPDLSEIVNKTYLVN